MDTNEEITMLRGWLDEALGVIQEGRQAGAGALLPELESYLVKSGTIKPDDRRLGDYGSLYKLGESK